MLAVLAFALASAPAPAAEPVVTLPTYVVKEPRLLPKPEAWRYGQVPGFEILSDASEGQTKTLIHDFLLFQRAVGPIWPAVKRNFDLPVSLILCSNPKRFVPFVPADLSAAPAATYSLSLREREMASIILNLQAANPQAPAGLDEDESGLTASLSDYAAGILRGEYVHFLLSRIDPPPAAWLEAGLGQLLLSLKLSEDAIAIPASADTGDLAWRKAFAASAAKAGAKDGQPPPLSMEKDQNLQTALSAGAIMPLLQMLRQTSDAAPTGTAETAWGRECYQFVHLCIFGKTLHLQKGLVEFAIRSSLQPPDEEMFRQCFGLGTRQMLLALWAYTDFSTNLGFAFEAKGAHPPPPPALDLRPATDAEVGRIRGDALRMAGHLEAAHYSLIAPYLRGSRDPQLLAALGLEESAAGKRDRALRFLEAAVAAKTSRARAYYELARLRLGAAGPGRLNADRLMPVIKPLWDGRSHPPPLQEIYELFAEIWGRAAFKPARGNLAVVDEGVNTFPFDTDLIYADAHLRAQFGYTADANALAGLGLDITLGKARDRFLDLRRSLPRSTAQIPAATANSPQKSASRP